MMQYFTNISGGNVRSLWPTGLAAILDGIVRVFPAVLLVDIFNTMYMYFAEPQLGLDTTRLWTVSILLFGWMFISYWTFSILYDRSYYTAYRQAASGRLELAEHIRRLSLGFFNRRDPADMTNLLLSDYAQVETTISHNVPQLISGIIMPVFAFAGLMFLDWRMTLAMFVALPFGLLLLWLTNSLQERLCENQVRARNEAASRLQEYLGGIREIKAHNMGGDRFQRLRLSFLRLKETSIQLEAILGPLIMGAMLLARSGMTIMILVGSYLLLDGSLTLPIFLLFLLVGTRIFDPLTAVLTNYGEMKYSAFSAQRIMDVRREQPLQGDKDINPNGSIVFEDVTFSYNEPALPALKDVSFTIKPNTITALVGSSGSGKSTVTRLISRFWDVQQGEIRIGGQALHEADPERLLQHIAIVFQDVYLFQDTIGNNIRIGNMNATQAEVEEAAKRACCHDFIAALPQGYDTPVGEGGSTLSGGEKQRISIARALLKDAPIVLLDEATASLDAENESAVQQAINELVAHKTVVIIAHRLKTIQHADHIIVLEQGSVSEEGTHQSLVSSGGIYSKLWGLQQNAEGWNVRS
ncbi:ABC transporter ATP-binding protein/permease [Paenibacillus sp. SC116]|uniref:ABC transporter ATP-binding protein n=1 Tax=Paenibacillus sp. SC116 TaxID=2968986 RepID=UPI00215B576B|nr:ABC transporter ATP-binding protein [Paenibacillus sp. SC116]MCR8846413.1 ABC transporter ATP-binding protein/permease [Paenibacillus sp. SC116]